MQKDQSDQELNFKKRARRRLVGAIALVLLMVIILPMVLKDRALSGPQEKIAITMPSDHAAKASAPSDFDSNVVPNSSAATEAAQTEETQPTELDLPAPSEEVVETPAEAPTNKPADKASDKPAPVAEEKSAPAHKFYVQVGVFSNAASVKELQAKLDGLGYKSRKEKIKTDKGEKIRLKTQVFADRNEAAIALQNIKDAGLTGMVVSQ